MQALPSQETISTRWGKLAHVLSCNVCWFGIILALLFVRGRLLSFAVFPLVLLLWLCTRRSSPVRPRLPAQPFSRTESRLWFGGAGICVLALLGCAYAAGVRDAWELLQTVAVGCASWAFLFLTVRDCRRTLQRTPVA